MLIDLMHTLVREDPFTLEITKALDSAIEKSNIAATDLEKQYWFDSMTWGADYLASILEIRFPQTATIEEKRSIIEARWKSTGKSDIYLLQAIADSWKNGEVQISFINGKINIKFTGNYGVPDDLESLKKELDNAKPAHLRAVYDFKYLLVEDIHQAMTLEDMEQIEIDKFAF